jgi:hypothetical protein
VRECSGMSPERTGAWASVRGEAGETQAAGARSSALTKMRCSPPLHSRTKTRSGSFTYQPTTSPPEPSAMPSVSQVTRILSPCLKVQSSDRVGALLVVIRIFIDSEGLWLRPPDEGAPFAGRACCRPNRSLRYLDRQKSGKSSQARSRSRKQKSPVSGAFLVAGAGFEPATSGL